MTPVVLVKVWCAEAECAVAWHRSHLDPSLPVASSSRSTLSRALSRWPLMTWCGRYGQNGGSMTRHFGVQMARSGAMGW